MIRIKGDIEEEGKHVQQYTQKLRNGPVYAHYEYCYRKHCWLLDLSDRLTMAIDADIYFIVSYLTVYSMYILLLMWPEQVFIQGTMTIVKGATCATSA